MNLRLGEVTKRFLTDSNINLSLCQYAEQNKKELWFLPGRPDGLGYQSLDLLVGEKQNTQIPLASVFASQRFYGWFRSDVESQ